MSLLVALAEPMHESILGTFTKDISLPSVISSTSHNALDWPRSSLGSGCCWEAAIPSTSNNHTKTSTRKEPASGAKAGRCEAIAGAGIIKETKLNLKIYILTC